MWTLLAMFAACSPTPAEDPGPDTVPWSGDLPALSEDAGAPRGFVPLRAILHLHSPYSHDACDGDGLVDGAPDPECLADLREGLCRTGIDLAFGTDHPAHAADQPFEDLLLAQPGDELILEGGSPVGAAFACPDRPPVAWLPGFEHRLMPVGLPGHVAASLEESRAIYRGNDAESVTALVEGGALVFNPHTESRSLSHLEVLQDAGMSGIEVFNLHAMFGPDRREDLGLDPYGWFEDLGHFTRDDATAEPDLLFLAVLEEQGVTVERWDGLLARGPTVGIAGTDAHQNVLPLDLRDGERVDSYRRMLRWFSNVLLAEGRSAAAGREALAAGRLFVAFEALGTPRGFDLHLVDDAGEVWEMGSDTPAGTLQVDCPTLSPASPRGLEAPEITVTVYRDGEPWQTGCGAFPVEGPAVFRVRVDIVPHHLRPFLGDDPERWLRSYPWIYSNALRVGL